MNKEPRAALERPPPRPDRPHFYPRPLPLEGVRLARLPLFFRLPRLRRYSGYAFRKTILLRHAPGQGASDDLITHELCHIWQMQHRPFHVVWKWATTRYRENPYEIEARQAVAATREPA